MKVGIFFFLDGEIIIDAVPVEWGKAVGDAIQYGNHYEFWNAIQPKSSLGQSFKEWPYNSFPRGKVVYIPREHVFRVYTDACLLPSDIASVIKYFGHEGTSIQIESHKDYQCAKCNEYFDLALQSSAEVQTNA
jgi:hypothetical protein